MEGADVEVLMMAESKGCGRWTVVLGGASTVPRSVTTIYLCYLIQVDILDRSNSFLLDFDINLNGLKKPVFALIIENER